MATESDFNEQLEAFIKLWGPTSKGTRRTYRRELQRLFDAHENQCMAETCRNCGCQERQYEN